MNRGRVMLSCWACVLLGLTVLAQAALVEVFPPVRPDPFGAGFNAERSSFSRAPTEAFPVFQISVWALAESPDSLEEDGEHPDHSVADVCSALFATAHAREAAARATRGRRHGVLVLNHRLRC